MQWVIQIVVVPVILKLIELIPTMFSKKKEMPRVKAAKNKLKNKVLVLSGHPTHEEIVKAAKGEKTI